MMKAIKNFMNKPVTWGDSFKWSGIVLGLYAAVIGACVAYEKWTDYKAEKEMLKKMASDKEFLRFISLISARTVLTTRINELEEKTND